MGAIENRVTHVNGASAGIAIGTIHDHSYVEFMKTVTLAVKKTATFEGL